MKPISRAYKILIVWVILSAVAFVGYTLLFLEVREQNESVALLADTLAFEVERNERLDSIESLVENTEDERDLLKTHFLAEEEIVIFLGTIEGLAQDAGVFAEIQSANIVETTSGATVLRLSVSTEGSWGGIFHFVSFVENLSIANDITSANFSSQDTSELGPSWKASFIIEALMVS